MSCIVLQIGQCGNQIGNHFWNAIQNSNLNKNCFVLENPRNNLFYYRSINIDTEPKVIKKIVEQKGYGSYIFRPGCAIVEKCGRGNNWAMGYYKHRLSHTDDIFERALEELRKECERGDNHKVTLMIHSLSGGTGSGVSSRLSEMIKDEIPSRPLIACSVAPFETGDTPMQNYNTLLALHKLNEQCDAILMQHNDRLMAQLCCGKLTAGKGPNFSDLNALIAENLTGLSLPTNHQSVNDFCMLEALTEAMSLNKFLLSCSVNEPFRSWNKAVDKLLNFSEPVNTFYVTHGKSEKRYTQKHHNGYFLVARGSNNLPLSSEVTCSIDARIREFCRIDISAPQQFWESPANISKEKSQSISMTLAYRNNNFMRNYLSKILQSANDQFHVKAYVHWYERFGGSIEDFQDCFHYFQTLQKNM